MRAGDVPSDLSHPLGVLELTSGQLEAEVKELLVELVDPPLQLVARHIA